METPTCSAGPVLRRLAAVALLALALPGAPQAGEALTRRQHGEWTVQCRQGGGQQPLCIAFTPLKSATGAKAGILGAQPVAGQRLLTFSMESGYGVGGQIELRVDGNPSSRHGGCENLHCHIVLEADDPLQMLLKRGNQLYIRGSNTDYQASLIGYTAAQESWVELQKSRR